MRRGAQASLSICALWAWSCGGTIETGTNLADGAFGSADGGLSGPGIDAGSPSNCVNRQEPTIQTAWPFTRTQAAYESHFAGNLPGRTTCVGCHGPTLTPPNNPIIPAPNDPAFTTDDIDAIWARVIPTTNQIPPPPMPIAPLLWHHNPMGANGAPAYSVEQLTYIQKFIDDAHNCVWIPTQMQDRANPPCMTGPPCVCPITLDLSYCGQ
jgi:hypothetical protein